MVQRQRPAKGQSVKPGKCSVQLLLVASDKIVHGVSPYCDVYFLPKQTFARKAKRHYLVAALLLCGAVGLACALSGAQTARPPRHGSATSHRNVKGFTLTEVARRLGARHTNSISV
jgi:hypothetical protein